MAKILYISEQHQSLDAFPDVGQDDFEVLPAGSVPTIQQVREADTVLLLGSVNDGGRASQIAGVFRLSVHHGTTVVFAHPERLLHEALILDALAPHRRGELPGSHPVEASHPAFHEYLSIFGRSHMEFGDLPEDSEILGTLQGHSAHPPAAWCAPVGAGGVYVVPFFLAGAGGFLSSLLDAVQTHRSGESGFIPDFLTNLRVATEDELLSGIDSAERALQTLRQRASELSRFRLLVGHLSGDAFEQLVIHTLNVVFEGTDHLAEDREDLRAEDFWVSAAGQDRALAEAKGIGRHVRREDVNQVDNHRAGLERVVEELPGLLVVNVFRGDESLESRELPVNQDVIRHAVRQNVLVLRGIDLYHLVSQRLGGANVGDELISALYAGGGWLEVTAEAISLRNG
jgi:hypothetical protein